MMIIFGDIKDRLLINSLDSESYLDYPGFFDNDMLPFILQFSVLNYIPYNTYGSSTNKPKWWCGSNDSRIAENYSVARGFGSRPRIRLIEKSTLSC